MKEVSIASKLQLYEKKEWNLKKFTTEFHHALYSLAAKQAGPVALQIPQTMPSKYYSELSMEGRGRLAQNQVILLF